MQTLSSYVNTTDGGTAGVAGGGARHVQQLGSTKLGSYGFAVLDSFGEPSRTPFFKLYVMRAFTTSTSSVPLP